MYVTVSLSHRSNDYPWAAGFPAGGTALRLAGLAFARCGTGLGIAGLGAAARLGTARLCAARLGASWLGAPWLSASCLGIAALGTISRLGASAALGTISRLAPGAVLAACIFLYLAQHTVRPARTGSGRLMGGWRLRPGRCSAGRPATGAATASRASLRKESGSW